MAVYPICVRCPECGGGKYKSVKPDRYVAFMQDRVCLNCQTRYVIPTPKWASVVFLVVGLPLALASAFQIAVLTMNPGVGFPVGFFISGVLGFAGLASVGFGIQSLFERAVEPPIEKEPPPEQMGEFAANLPPKPSDNPYQSPRA